MKSKAAIIMLTVMSAIVIAAAVIIAINMDQLKIQGFRANRYRNFITEQRDSIGLLGEQIKAEQEDSAQLSETISSLQLQIDEITDENKRLYNLIASEDTNKNIEDYFEKVVYLTFDDGPTPLTDQVLDILDAQHVKATFFVIYTKYGEKNNMYKEIVDRGHAIGNHTYSHTYPYKNWEKYMKDMFKMEDFIYEQTGIRPKIFRFPGGSSNRWNYDAESIEYVDSLHAMGYEFFDWTTSTSDSGAVGISADDIMWNVMVRTGSGTREKVIVLMHDKGGNMSTVKALPRIISYFKMCGYTFLPLNVDSFAPHIYGIDSH